MTPLGARIEARRSPRLSDEERHRIGRGLILLRHVGVIVTQRIDCTVGAVVSGNSEIAMLITLRDKGPQRPVQLAEAAGLTTGGLSKALDRLARHELVTRGARGTDGDGRAVVVTLTPKGQRTTNTLDDVASAALRQASDELDEVMAIAAQIGISVDSVAPAAGGAPLARLSRAGVVLTEAMRQSPIDDHTAVLVLCVLDGEGGCRPARLVELLGMSSGGVTKLVDRLVARGLVARSYGMLAADRRGVELSITPAGLDKLDAVLSLVVGDLREIGAVIADLGTASS